MSKSAASCGIFCTILKGGSLLNTGPAWAGVAIAKTLIPETIPITAAAAL